ncbi:hypothetical protein [Alkalihalobacterium chitinilyticum]|uniref:DUF1049 domain-containing protein n=1 Tax=Alkalihalobacterium chitinilyticum TaxID=2980103 RepID=A0ABT5VL91_9BACI|nr:hypothetical protein [Alkalihalobacterium chitinilyticum]MDE5415527.1 hypothetical protein [Alkalihalobacterium chitinilyticum]
MTLAFFLVLFGMVLLMTVFNFLVYDHFSLIESFLLLVWFEMGSRRMIVVAAAVVGLMVAIYQDIQRKKNKNQQKQERLQ